MTDRQATVLMERIVTLKDYLKEVEKIVGYDYTMIDTAKVLIARYTKKLRKEIMLNPPNEVVLDVHLPESVDTPRKLRNYFLKHFGIDIDVDPESDYHDSLFHNSDLRSYMGDVWDEYESPVRIAFLTKYYIDRQYVDETKVDLSGSYSKRWRQIVRQSDICDTNTERVVSKAIGEPVLITRSKAGASARKFLER